MFTKVSLRNFRSFDEIVFDLNNKNNTAKSLAVIYGENGAGKSNLMSAFVLINELLSTLDIRDKYEDFLNQKSIFSDESFEKAVRKTILSGFRDIRAIIDDYHMIGSKESTEAEFEFSIGGSRGSYCVKLGEEEIIYERLEYVLNKRRGTYFECSKERIYINNIIVTDSDLYSDIKALAKRFWGKHSILAIILHEMRDKSTTFGWENISENFYDVLAEFSMLSTYIGIGSRQWNNLRAPIDILANAAHGQISKNDENKLNIVEQVFSSFFSSINSDIRKVYYERRYNDTDIDYNLVFEKLVAGTYRSIPFSKESTGNHQLLKILCYILCACLGSTVIIDEADSGIHDMLFKKIVIEIQSLISGQLIITTHNTMIMESDFARDSVYILDEQSGGRKTIKCINDYDKRTYANNSIRNKYLNNEYGGLPIVKPIDFPIMLNQLLEELEQ